MKSRISRGLSKRARSAVTRPFSGFAQHPLRVDSGAVVGDPDHDVVAFLLSLQMDGALAGLAGRVAYIRQLQTVVERVPHQVNQRIANELDHGFVEFGILARN